MGISVENFCERIPGECEGAVLSYRIPKEKNEDCEDR